MSISRQQAHELSEVHHEIFLAHARVFRVLETLPAGDRSHEGLLEVQLTLGAVLADLGEYIDREEE